VTYKMVKRSENRDESGECVGYWLSERTSGSILGYCTRSPTGSPFVVTEIEDERIISLKDRLFDKMIRLEAAVAKLL